MTTAVHPTTTGPIADLVRFLQDPGGREVLVARAAAVLGSRADAEDAVSDRIIRFLENPPQDGLRHPAAYLGRGVVFSAINLHQARRGAISEAVLPELADTRTSNPEQCALDEELRAKVREAVAELPARDGDLIRRVYFAEQSRGAIAQALGITVNALNVRLFRALRRLRVSVLRHGIRSRA